MNTLKKLTLLFFMSLAIVSCNKDDDNTEENGGPGGGAELFTATIAGAGFTASTDPASLIGGSLTTNNGTSVLVAQGSTNGGNFINFSIVNYSGPGTYTTGDNLMNANLIQYGEVMGQSASVWGSNLATAALGTLMPGEITVTVQDETHAEGTFSFEGYNATDMSTKVISSGEFNVKFDN